MVNQSILIVLVALMQSGGAAPAWRPFSTTRGGYTVLLPGKPTEKRQPRTLPTGVIVETNSATVKRSSITSYSVAASELDMPPDDPTTVLDAIRDELIKIQKGKLIDESPTELQGMTGRELKVEIPKTVVAGGAVARARVLLMGRWLYEIVAVQSTAEAKAHAGDVDNFFASFAVTAKPAATAKPADTKPADTPKIGAIPKDRDRSAKAEMARNTAEAKSSDKPANANVSAEWKDFVPPDKAFAASLPGEPTEHKFTVPSPSGPSQVITYALTTGDFAYAISSIPISGGAAPQPGTEDDFFTGFKARLLKSVDGTSQSERKVTLDDVSGWELTATIPPNPRGRFPKGADFRCRSYLVGNRVYAFSAISAEGAESSKEVEAFFDGISLGAAAAARATPPKPAAAAPPAQPVKSLKDGWQPYRSVDGRFSVAFPAGEPKDQTEQVKAAAGEIDVHSTVLYLAKDGVYIVTYFDLPSAAGASPADRDKLLDAAIDRLLAGRPGSKLAKQTKITLDGHPGRELTVTLPDQPKTPGGGVIMARIYTAGDRHYRVIREGPKSAIRDDELAAFFESFHITKN
jgi:hypothetical protein